MADEYFTDIDRELDRHFPTMSDQPRIDATVNPMDTRPSPQQLMNDIQQENEYAHFAAQQAPMNYYEPQHESFADNVIGNNDNFKIVSGIFSDIKDPIIMLVVAMVLMSRWGRRKFKEYAPWGITEEGSVTFSGHATRFAVAMVAFFIVRRVATNYFSMPQ